MGIAFLKPINRKNLDSFAAELPFASIFTKRGE
jgi:hypothetical protein